MTWGPCRVCGREVNNSPCADDRHNRLYARKMEYSKRSHKQSRAVKRVARLKAELVAAEKLARRHK